MESDSTGSPEFEAIARWCSSAKSSSADLLVGPGDDCAWLRSRGSLAVSTDSFTEGIHFQRTWAPGEQVGARAMAAALSDLAASRARPIGCVVAIASPIFDDYCDAVMAGVNAAAERWACPLLGGDTTRAPEKLGLHITVLGEPSGPGPLLRSGAAAGDLLLLSGPLGASARAVARLLDGEDARWPIVRPRLDLLPQLDAATAGIDISDGLLADGEHLAKASGLRLVLDRQPQWDDAALCGGEDYELLVTSPTPLPGFEVIGRAEAGSGILFSDGSPLPPRPWGFVHGAGGTP